MATPRETIGFALILSVPPGVGVTAAVSLRTAEGTLTPLALGAGVLTFAGLFLLITVGASTGSTEADTTGESEP